MGNKNVVVSSKIWKVIGYVLFIVGVIELITNIFSFRYDWLYVVEHLTIGTSLLISMHIDNKRIIYCAALPLSITGVLCILVRLFL